MERSARPRVLIAAVVLVTVVTAGMVGLNAVLLGRLTQQVEAAQSRSANLSNTTRETLLLLQVVTDLPETADAQHLDVQRGVMGRRVAVAAASFPPDDPKARELLDVRTEVARFPWDRLVATGGREAALRLSAMSLISRSERRINALRSQEAKQFYAATVASLAAKQRGQFALAALMTVVLGLGAGGIAVVMRRSRSDVEKAYSALKGEVNERRVAEEALRASEGRFRSLVQRASDLTIVTDDGGVVTYVSPAVEALVGYPPDDFLDLPLLVHVEPQERGAVATSITRLAEQPGLVLTIELRLCTRDGRVRSVEAVCQNLVDDPDVGLVWNGRDVTDRRALENELTHLAHHDPLTDLPNRAVLLRRLGDVLTQRHAGPSRRGRAAAGRRATAARLRAGGRRRRPARRRRVRGDGLGRRLGTGGRDRQADRRRPARALHRGRPPRHGRSQRRRRPQRHHRDGRRPAPRRRHRHVHRWG